MQAFQRSFAASLHVPAAAVPGGAESTSSFSASCHASKNMRLGFASGSRFTYNAVQPLVKCGNGRVRMAKESAAQGYAAALVQIAKGNNVLDAVHSDMEGLSNLIGKPELYEYLTNPTVADENKKSILKTLGTDAGFNNYTMNFLNLLVDKRRLNAIKDICAEVEEQYCQLTDTQVAVVTSAVKLDNSQTAMVAKKLQTMTGAKQIKLKNVVDPSLIAGFTVKFGKDGSRQIDLSVKGQLDRLAASFEFAENAA